MTTYINIIPYYFRINIIYFIGLFFLFSFSYCKYAKAQQYELGNTFIKIFDGKTLTGWEGDSTYWRVEDGSIVGEVTEKNLLERNSFLIWRQGTVSDFEIKLEYRISEMGNSGINYRSEEVEGDPDAYVGGVPYALRGYQADIDGQNFFTGMNYEERGRTTIGPRGLKVLLPEIDSHDFNIDDYIAQNQWLLYEIQDTLMDLSSINVHINQDWNEYHIIAKKNILQHYINGNLISEVTDKDTLNRRHEGLLGVQVHVGPPMKVEFRNIRLKKIK